MDYTLEARATNKQNLSPVLVPFPTRLGNATAKQRQEERAHRLTVQDNIDGFAEVKAGTQSTSVVTPTGKAEREQTFACLYSVTLCKTRTLGRASPTVSGSSFRN